MGGVMGLDFPTPGGATRPKPKLIEQVRDAIRRRHYSYRTEETYVHWIKRFIYFHGKRHPRDLSEPEEWFRDGSQFFFARKTFGLRPYVASCSFRCLRWNVHRPHASGLPNILLSGARQRARTN